MPLSAHATDPLLPMLPPTRLTQPMLDSPAHVALVRMTWLEFPDNAQAPFSTTWFNVTLASTLQSTEIEFMLATALAQAISITELLLHSELSQLILLTADALTSVVNQLAIAASLTLSGRQLDQSVALLPLARLANARTLPPLQDLTLLQLPL